MPQNVDQYTDELAALIAAGDHTDRERLRRFLSGVWVSGATFSQKPLARAANQDALLGAVEFLLLNCVYPGMRSNGDAAKHLTAIRQAQVRTGG